MDISTFRKERGLSLEAFGRIVGKSKGHLSEVERTGRCSAKLALDIEAATGGKVSADSLNAAIAAARLRTEARP